MQSHNSSTLRVLAGYYGRLYTTVYILTHNLCFEFIYIVMLLLRSLKIISAVHKGRKGLYADLLLCYNNLLNK